MSAKIDPYYQWLAIGPEEQPPHHYRLLGVKPLEDNLDVIETAADQKMLHLRTYQSGKHAELSQKLLNEIATAKVTLLDPAKKGAYDAELRVKLNAAKQAELKQARQERPLAMAKPLPTAAPLEARPAAPTTATLPQFQKPTTAARRRSNPLVMIVAGAIVLGLLAVGGVAAMMLAGGQEVAEVDPAPTDPPMNDRPDVETPIATDPAPPVVPPVVPPASEDESATDPPSDETPVEDADEPIDEEPIVEDPGEEIAVEEEPATPEKLPVPDKAEREAKRKEILKVFAVADAKTFEQKGELAAQLIRTAGETADDPAAQFALLNLAREQAAEAGQIKLAFEATDLLAETFVFDGGAVRLASIQQASRAVLPPAAKREIVVAGMAMIDELSASDKYDEADALSDRMLAVARPLRDAELTKRIADQRRAFTEQAASFKKAQAAFATLKTSPDDAEANLAAGRYLTFVKQDWDTGLAHLAKGSDAALAAAAQAELASPDAPADQEKLADAWWAAAEAQKDTALKDFCRAQALSWYREVVDALTGLTKIKIEKRIAEAGEVASAARRLTGRKPPRQILRIPISAFVDGLDTVRIFATKAEWHHKSHSWPADVRFNGQPWNAQSLPSLDYGDEVVKRVGQFDFESAELVPVDAPGPVRLVKGADHVDIELSHVDVSGGGRFNVVLMIRTLGEPIETAEEPDLGVFSRDPADVDLPASDGTIYLDDLEETESKVGHGSLGKHGNLGWDQPEGPFFGDKALAHALSMHAVSNDIAYIAYDLDGRFALLRATAGLWQFERNFSGASTTPLTFQVLGDGKVLWKSKPLQKQGAGEAFSVSLRGVRKLRLEVHCPGNASEGVSAWFAPQLARAKLSSQTNRPVPTPIYLDDLVETSSRVGAGELGKHGAGGGGEFNGQKVEHSLTTHAVTDGIAHVTYQLNGAYDTFEALAGLWPLNGRSTQSATPIVFQVIGDEKALWRSNPVQKHGVGEKCRVSVRGVQVLRLEAHCPGNHVDAWAVWIEPRVSRMASRVPSRTPTRRELEVVYLDDLSEGDVKHGHHPLRKHGQTFIDSQPGKFGGEVPKHSLSIHAVANDAVGVSYELDGTFETFEGIAAQWDDGVGGRSGSPLTFTIFADDKPVWQSKPIQVHGTGQPFKVSIKGVRRLTLRSDCPGSSEAGWGVWINPRISRYQAKSAATNPELGAFSDDPSEIVRRTAPPEAVEFEGHYYLHVSKMLPRAKAAADCEARGGYLVRIESAAEQEFVAALVRKNVELAESTTWIDGSDAEEEGVWKFGDGRLIKWTNWHESEPSHAAQEHFACLWMHLGAKWNDTLAIANLPFVCEWDAATSNTEQPVVYLDDFTEDDAKVGHSLGKHGETGWQGPGKFQGDTPYHALSTHALTDGTAYVNYSLAGKYDTLEATAGLWQYNNASARTPVTFRVVGDGKALWESPPLQQQGTGQQFKVNIRGVRKLSLQVVCPGDSWDAVAVWVNPRVARAPRSPLPQPKGEAVYLDDLVEQEFSLGFGVLGKRGTSCHGDRAYTYQGAIPEHALSMHATRQGVSSVSYALDGKFSTFGGTAGLWEQRGYFTSQAVTPVTFRVLGDGKPLWESKPVQQHGTGQDFQVSVRGVKLLTLQIVCSGSHEFAWGLWIDPRVSRAAPKPTE